MEFLPDTIYIFTDGGIKGQNGVKEDKKNTIGAHSFILLLNGKEYSHAEAQRNSTSNREEMLAILHALQKLNTKVLSVRVTSDSQYCVNGLKTWMKAWKKKEWKTSTNEDVKNKDLWKQLDEIVSEFKDIKFGWVKGHSGDYYNERCDRMCQDAIKEFEKKVFPDLDS